MTDPGGHEKRRKVDERSKLRIVRKSMGLSSDEAAHHMGCNPAVFLRIERGSQRYISCELKSKIALFFGLDYVDVNRTI